MRSKSRTDEGEMWRCDSCGAYNDESFQVCSECSAERLGGPSKGKEKHQKGKRPKGGKSSKKKGHDEKEPKAVKAVDDDFEASEAKAKKIEPELSSPVGLTSEPIQDSKMVEPTPSFVIGGVGEDNLEKPASQFSFSQPASAETASGHYYLLFVESPVQSLLNSKVLLDFGVFPTISIGRGPENVVVVSDDEVSRKHAELAVDGNRVVLKDLQSSNGTFVHDGIEFQQVHDSVEVNPNTMVRFGKRTTVKLISE